MSDRSSISNRSRSAFALLTCVVLALAGSLGCAAQRQAETALQSSSTSVDLSMFCRPEAVQAVASRVSASRVTIQQVSNGPNLPGGVRYVAASERLGAYCQISGSYVTNPETGKTANFLATLPATWNGRYLQLGCSGHCGQFAVSDATTSTIPITNQGRPGDIINRGYASFATDEGHSGYTGGTWAINADGGVNQDAIDDFLIRAQRVLSDMGKEFTVAFYSDASGQRRSISYSYFSGCSGGGRDALVAASYFPEEFDGIIAGSPYSNMAGIAFQTAGASLAHILSEDADITDGLMSRVDAIVREQCDRLDGVEDGVIQNPAACNFAPERDLPRCQQGQASNQCFTPAQIATVSTYITATTDERGALVQPGFSVSNLQASMRMPPAADRAAVEPWPSAAHSTSGPLGGMWGLGDATIRIFVHRADPNFHLRSVLAHREGGPGDITAFRTVVPRAEVDRATQVLRNGIGAIPENSDRFFRLNRRLLIWSNLSDQLLTPYGAINYYNQLAERQGGYDRLQENVRLFGLPGTAHCSMGGFGVNSFDALAAMEAWVERGEAPNALLASQYASRPDPNIPQLTIVNYDAAPVRTMPLCMYPQMARYSGRGDVNDAVNWSCHSDDRRMLTVGESGRRAGVVQ